MRRGLYAPLMIVGADNSCTTGTCRPTTAVERGIRASSRSLLAASTGPTWCYSIDGTKHFNFTDYAAYYLAAPLRLLVPLGDIDGRRGLSINNSLRHRVPRPRRPRPARAPVDRPGQPLPRSPRPSAPRMSVIAARGASGSTSQWRRISVPLALALSAFAFNTTENLPIGLLRLISTDLDLSAS